MGRVGGVRVSEEFIVGNPGADPTATELVINVLTTAALVQHELERLLRPHRLSLGSFKVLQVIEGAGEAITPGDVCRRIDTPVTTATVTGVLDTLERAGRVRRDAHPTDRRRVLVSITAKGRTVLGAVLPEVFEAEKRWAAPLSRADRSRVVDALGAVAAALGRDQKA